MATVAHYRRLLRSCLGAHPHLTEGLRSLRGGGHLEARRVGLEVAAALAGWVARHDGRTAGVLARESHLAGRVVAEAIEEALKARR